MSTERLRRIYFKEDFEHKVDGALKIALTAEEIYRDLGYPCVLTAGTDGTHMVGSKHYTGDALDIRTNFLSKQEQEDVTWQLQVELGSDYDVLLEKTHIHVEYDPK